MRLLLILALVIASMGFAPPANAWAGQPEPQHHHAHMTDAGHHAGGHENDQGQRETQHVAHVCPGCAFLGQPAAVVAAPLMPQLPKLGRDPASLESLDTNPIPPPPRGA